MEVSSMLIEHCGTQNVLGKALRPYLPSAPPQLLLSIKAGMKTEAKKSNGLSQPPFSPGRLVSSFKDIQSWKPPLQPT